MKKLAIHGGSKIRKSPFPSYDVIDKEEIKEVTRVLKTGILSRFLGVWHKDFYGGPEVQSLEKEWAKYFKVKHAISVNSATSGLISAVGALGIGPGDEVIVTPYSMCISATAPLFYGATPVFADVEPEYFCLDPKSIEKKITKRTKAIIVVNLFGQPYDAEKINKIAKKHNIAIIEDSAQSPGAKYQGKYAGTLGDIGIFSLNYHKHIHSGEGGIVVTNNDEFAERIRLIRNHAEAVVEAKGVENIINMVGFNFRMTEIEAAIARCQLRKLKPLIDKRRKNVVYLTNKLKPIPFLKFPATRLGATHSFYMHPFLFDSKRAGVSRTKFIDAVRAELMPTKRRETEGVKVNFGYVKPIYLMPMFQQKIAFGPKGWPFNKSAQYKKGLCPVVERLHFEEFCSHELMHPNMTKKDLDNVVSAFTKVAENLDELK